MKDYAVLVKTKTLNIFYGQSSQAYKSLENAK